MIAEIISPEKITPESTSKVRYPLEKPKVNASLKLNPLSVSLLGALIVPSTMSTISERKSIGVSQRPMISTNFERDKAKNKVIAKKITPKVTFPTIGKKGSIATS